VPRAALFGDAGAKNGCRRFFRAISGGCPEVNEAVVATYLAGGNTRQIRGALQPLLKAAPLSPRGQSADQVAQDRLVAEDRHCAQPAHGRGMMFHHARRTYRS